jgi:hypothetical protein
MQEGCSPSWGSEEIIEVDAKDRWVSINWIGASTFKTIQPSIDEHDMWIYEVDGHYIEPRMASTMLLWAGERYSAMVRLDKYPMDYTIRVIDGGYSQMIGTFATLRYKGGEQNLAELDQFNVTTVSKPWFLYNAWPVGNMTFLDKLDMPPWPPEAPAPYSDEVHVLELGKANSTWEFTLGGRKKYPSDRSAYSPLIYDVNSPEATDEDLIIRTKNGTWHDIILQVGHSPLWPVEFPVSTVGPRESMDRKLTTTNCSMPYTSTPTSTGALAPGLASGITAPRKRPFQSTLNGSTLRTLHIETLF